MKQMINVSVAKRSRRALFPMFTDRIEVAYFIFFYIAILLKSIYFQFTTQLNVLPAFSNINRSMFLATAGIVLALMGLTLCIPNRHRFLAMFILDVLLTTVLVADTNFFRYYYAPISIPVFYQFNFSVLGSVNQSIMSLFKLKDIIFLLDLPVLITVMVYMHKKGIRRVNPRKKAFVCAVLAASGILVFLPAYASTDRAMFRFDNNYVAKSLGVLYFHGYNTRDFINERILQDNLPSTEQKETIAAFFDKNAVNGTFMEGAAKGKNLIVVQMEAMQQFIIGRSINGQEITPNLNKLIKESLYFPNIYYEVSGGNTSDAEFLSNTSLFPLREGAVYHQYPENHYISLPNVLKQQGYNTYALHAFKEEFWNRKEMYKAIGFDTFYSSKNYKMDELIGWEGQSLSDASFFRQSLDMLDTSKPFYSFFITLSSHHPFKYFEDFPFDAGKYNGTYLGSFLKAEHYADQCLGQFIQELKNKGLYDNSLLVFYGDHSAVPKHQSDDMMEFLGVKYNEWEWIKQQKVPLIIHVPGMSEGRVMDVIGGQVDVFPTIANLMGFETPYAIGKDLLNTEKGYAILRNGSVVTDQYCYANSTGELFDMKTGQKLKMSAYRDEIRSYQDHLYLSDMIIAKNMLRGK